MPTAKKRDKVKELQQLLAGSQVLIFTDYRGLSVAEITNLRRQLREKGVEYHVTKNTLTELAATRANLEHMVELLDGPTAIAFVGDDIPGGTKALTDFVRTARSTLQIRGGLMGLQMLSADQVNDLTKLLTREQYIAQLMGAMNGPVGNFVNVLASTIRSVMNVLNARADQLKEQGDTSGEATAEEAPAVAEEAAPAAEESPAMMEAEPAEAEATEAPAAEAEAEPVEAADAAPEGES